MNHYLVNYAMLESINVRKKGDVYDNCALLFAATLNTQNMFNPFTVEEGKEIFLNYLNFDLPVSVVQLILNRAKKKFDFFSKKEGVYTPNRSQIVDTTSDFIDVKNEVLRSNTKLLESFVSYVKSNFEKDMSIDQAQEALVAYLSKYQVEIIDFFAVGGEVEVKGKSLNNISFLFSSFLKHINEKEPEIFKYFISHVKGIFLKNYMTSSDMRDNQSNLSNVTFYLDTPLILGLLGFSGESKQVVIEEMVELCNSLKAKMAIFECTRTEFENILKAWANDLESKNLRNFRDSTLQLLRMNMWDHEFLRNYLSRYHSVLSKKNISVVRNPEFTEDYQIDSEGLINFLQSEANNEYLAVNHDVRCVGQVIQLREYKRKSTLKDKSHIFVTTSNFLVSNVNQFLKNDFDKESSPVIANDIWVTNMCWMMNPDLFPDWAEHLVVSNYQAIIHEDDRFWKEFLNRFRMLRDTQKISKEDYDLVRRDFFLKKSVKILSVTEGMSYNDEHVFELMEKTKNRVLKRKDTTIESQGNIILSYRGKLRKVCDLCALSIRGLLQFVTVAIVWLTGYYATKGSGYEEWGHASSVIGIAFSYFGFAIKDFGCNLERKVSDLLYSKIGSYLERKKL
ncbi:hypothetical protein ABMA70_05040 [Halobacteriovorax sp. XZX-3]|uniref:hypothetical protein n=1 Tax=unclassified Halobacteriovorax TaxID=2639665 RepID=UPI0037165933